MTARTTRIPHLPSGRLRLQVPPDGAPQVPVRSDLAFQVLESHPTLESLPGRVVPAAVRGAAIVPFAREEALNKRRDLGRDLDEAGEVLTRQHRHVVHVEYPD